MISETLILFPDLHVRETKLSRFSFFIPEQISVYVDLRLHIIFTYNIRLFFVPIIIGYFHTRV